MHLVVLNVAYPFAPVGPDAIGGAEEIVGRLDAALVRAGHESIVMACEGSITEGILLATQKPSDTLDEAARRRIHEQYRFTLQTFLKKWPIDLIHMHGVDFYEYLPPPGIPVLVTLHFPVHWYPDNVFRLKRPQTYLDCVARGQHGNCPPGAKLLPEIGSAVAWDEEAQTTAEHFSGPRLIERYLAVYERLVANARAAAASVSSRMTELSAFVE